MNLATSLVRTAGSGPDRPARGGHLFLLEEAPEMAALVAAFLAEPAPEHLGPSMTCFGRKASTWPGG